MRVIDIHAITQTGANSDEKFVDGRPCFSPDGTTVLFERFKANQDVTQQQFWTVDIRTNSESCYYKSDTYGCLRASWSWDRRQKSKQIAFTGIYPEGHVPRSKIMLLDENGADNSATYLEVPGYKNAALSYPAWYPNEHALLMSNYSKKQLLKVNINSLDTRVLTDDAKYWTGMGTVNSADPTMIVFAGQKVNKKGYDQKKNNIYTQIGNKEPSQISDLSNIGRAPWFSPDGSIIAFEAHSVHNKLQIFIRKVDIAHPQSQPIIPVSDSNSPSQHAKFSPDGSKLIWAQSNEEDKYQIYMGTVIS